jgi:formylglycine-generating enzyme
LPKLTPLIWLRHAFMPDWFREALYDRLTPQQADRISQELSDIISPLKSKRDDTLRLYIATQPGAQPEAPVPTGRVRAWFQKLRRSRAVQEMGRVADRGSPLRDYVMLHYLSGRQGKALTPYVPKALLTLLFPKGQPWLRFRPGFLAVAAAMVSALLWWWWDPAPTPVPSAIVAVGFMEESNEVIVTRENGLVERWVWNDHALALSESGPERLFTDRLAKVKMGELTVADPKGHLKLDYQNEGQLLVINLDDGQELAREPAPPAQVASLHWPSGADAYLVVAQTVVPDLVTLSGLGNLRQQVIASRQEKQAAEEKAREEKQKAEEAKRLAANLAKKKAIEAGRQVDAEKQPPLQPEPTKVVEQPAASADMEQSRIREPEPSSPAQQLPEPAQTVANEKLDSRITGKDGAPMVLIPAGSFLMGSMKEEVEQAILDCVKEWGELMCERWYKPELPQHKVQMDAFYFDTYEVTNRRFQQFTRQTGYRTTAEREGSARVLVDGRTWKYVKGANWQKPEAGATVFDSNRAEHPVVAVSWDDAQAYCRWAEKRLPTEAEWEYAARAGTTTKYWWGQRNPGSRRVENIYNDGSVGTAPVGSYEANPWGLHDISGNVAEWTADWYGEDYYGKSPARNPTGPSGGEYRVIRGGSWSIGPVDVRSALRNRLAPTERLDNIGFRCAQDIPK